MAPKPAATTQGPSAALLQLPDSLVSRGDVVRLARELEVASSQQEQAQLHKAPVTALRLSLPLQDLLEINRFTADNAQQLQQVQQFLGKLKEAPSIHMSFATEPSPQLTAKLVTWLRQNIHPLILLNIGLQPTIAAGCIIRTQSKYFDCSMRQHLLQHRAELVKRLQVPV